ncbi:O-antigen ligase family protein [Microbacterium sp. NPDC091313]
MSQGPALPIPRLRALLASASFARAYGLTAIGTVFSALAIERLTGVVTLATILSGLVVIGIAMLVARRAEYSMLRLGPTTLVAFLAWVLISVAWSADETQTVGGWLGLAGIAIIAVVVALVRDTIQTVRALGDVLRVLLSLSLGLEIVSGIFLDAPIDVLGIQGRITDFGPIQGLYGTRNLLGFVTVIALITFLVEFRALSVSSSTAIYSVVLGGIVAVFTDSPTVLVVALAAGVAVAALMAVRHAPPERRSLLQWALGVAVIVVVIAGYALRDPLIRLLGAGTDFSLRSDLWSALTPIIRAHPVQGWGWYGAWIPEQIPFSMINYTTRQSHTSALNAYLDVLLQVGWVGLLLFLAFVGVALVRAWLDASLRRSVVYAWTPLILVAILADSFFESFALTGLGWFLLVLCAVRAGQSRSWRERMDPPLAPSRPALPSAGGGQGGPGSAG